MYFPVCPDYLASLSRVKCISTPVSYGSSSLFHQKHSCRIVPWIQIDFKISTLATTCRICQFQCCRTQSSDVLRTFVNLEKPGKVFFGKFSFGSSDTDNGFREEVCRGYMNRFAIQKTAFSFDSRE